MAVLAIHPTAANLHAAVSVGQFSETAVFHCTKSDQELAEQVHSWLGVLQIASSDLQFVVTSGHLPPGVPSGLYTLTDGFFQSNLQNRGPQIGRILKGIWGKPVYIIDPSSTLECDPLALVTGTPELNRGCRCDSFIFKHLVRQEEQKRGLSPASGNFVVAHLAEEIHIGAISAGRMVDGGTSEDEGPFSWQQAGALPFDGLLNLCLEMQGREEALRKVSVESGLQGYLGFEQFQDLFTASGEQASLIFQALVHQVSKEIGAYTTVLRGQVQGILLAGELAKHQPFVSALSANMGFLASVAVYPGNQGLLALADGALRILSNEPILSLNVEGSDAYGVC